jgi:hypothetical protein
LIAILGLGHVIDLSVSLQSRFARAVQLTLTRYHQAESKPMRFLMSQQTANQALDRATIDMFASPLL